MPTQAHQKGLRVRLPLTKMRHHSVRMATLRAGRMRE